MVIDEWIGSRRVSLGVAQSKNPNLRLMGSGICGSRLRREARAVFLRET